MAGRLNGKALSSAILNYDKTMDGKEGERAESETHARLIIARKPRTKIFVVPLTNLHYERPH